MAYESSNSSGSSGKYFHGLDADLAKKRDAKYSVDRERQAAEWIQAVTGENMSGSFHLCLKSGVVLCRLANALWPGAIRKINNSKMPFIQRENITNFLAVCRSKGMTETDLFVTQDVFEGDNLGRVIDSLFNLGALARRSGWNGAQLGVKLADKNQRAFTPEQRTKYVASRQTLGSSQNVVERNPVLAHQIVRDTSGHKASQSVLGRQTQGSAGYEVERNPQIAHQIKQDVSGHHASQSVLGRQTQGSAGYEVERNPVIAHQIKKDVSGHHASGVSRQTQGSYGYQDSARRVELRNSDIIRDVDAIQRDHQQQQR